MDTELLTLADDIATHPEIGFKEKRSVKKLTDYLQGARLRRGDGRRRPRHGVRREVQAATTAAPNLGVILEYDALRGTKGAFHGDQHSAQGPVGMAAGHRDGRVPRPKTHTPGSVTVFGTPGEEMMPPNAKTVMHEAHVVRRHGRHRPQPFVEPARRGRRPGFGTCCLNIDGVKYTFSGAPSHQMTPWNGRNALHGGDPALRQHRRGADQHPARGAHPGHHHSRAARRPTSCPTARRPTSTSAIPTRCTSRRWWSSWTTPPRPRRSRRARR